METKELLKAIMRFNDRACNCRVISDEMRVVSEYKSESIIDLKDAERAFSELGFKHISIRQYTEDNSIRYMPGTPAMSVEDILSDISYRFEVYSSVRKKLCAALSGYTEAEICAFIDVAFALMYELEIFYVRLDSIFGITDEQRAMFDEEEIIQYNSIFVPYIMSEIQSHKKGNIFKDQKAFSDIYEYLFSMFYTDDPLEQITFGERNVNGETVYGLKLKEKEATLADFLKELCSGKAVDILYKKKYGQDKTYLAESLKCAYYIAAGLEASI